MKQFLLLTLVLSALYHAPALAMAEKVAEKEVRAAPEKEQSDEARLLTLAACEQDSDCELFSSFCGWDAYNKKHLDEAAFIDSMIAARTTCRMEEEDMAEYPCIAICKNNHCAPSWENTARLGEECVTTLSE